MAEDGLCFTPARVTAYSDPRADHAGLLMQPTPGSWCPREAKFDALGAAAGVVAANHTQIYHVRLLMDAASASSSPAVLQTEVGGQGAAAGMVTQLDVKIDHAGLLVGAAS